MDQRIKLNDVEYKIEDLSDQAKVNFASLQFTDKRIKELSDMKAVLQRAKNSYVDALKKEMLSDKAGFLFDDD